MKLLNRSLILIPALIPWFAVFVLCGGCAGPQPAKTASQLWTELETASSPLAPPESWQTKSPKPDEMEQFRRSNATHLAKAADLAERYYRKFPGESNAPAARLKELELVDSAVEQGMSSLAPRRERLELARLVTSGVPESELYELRTKRVDRMAYAMEEKGVAAVMAAYEVGLRTVQKDFPNRTEIYDTLLMIAGNSDAPTAKRLVDEILASKADDSVKKHAAELKLRLDRIGKPVLLQFRALDGRDVDLGKMRGKVVLLDFWATWCGPCVAEVPRIKAAYSRLHSQGFDIVGISLDSEKEALESFVKDRQMPWPQHFDGKEWESPIAGSFGVTSLPSMWLVDKQGVLRDINAREDLESKVTSLLREN